MSTLTAIKPKAKKAAATAAGAFILANPLISMFLIGAGVGIYLTWRVRS